MPAWTRTWSDGQHRVWVPEGRGYEAREAVKAWSTAHDVDAVNIRVEQKVPFRDLDLIPDGLLPDLILAALDWLYPRTYAIRHKIVTDLEVIDEQDVRSMMYLFISDHADRYDADREGRNGTLNFLAYLLGKLRTWPQDAARTAFGRTVVGDRLALNRVGDRVAAAEHRSATEAERAGALGTSVSDLRRREQAIAALSGLRNYHSLVAGSPDEESLDAVQVASDSDVEADATAPGRNAALTRAIMAAVNQSGSTARRAQDPLALAAVYLTYWEELTRPEVARELEVLPKTVSSALARVHEQVQKSDLM
jgi:DNA-directed RNA polymerase specialized sigma24 family protein